MKLILCLVVVSSIGLVQGKCGKVINLQVFNVTKTSFEITWKRHLLCPNYKYKISIKAIKANHYVPEHCKRFLESFSENVIGTSYKFNKGHADYEYQITITSLNAKKENIETRTTVTTKKSRPSKVTHLNLVCEYQKKLLCPVFWKYPCSGTDLEFALEINGEKFINKEKGPAIWFDHIDLINNNNVTVCTKLVESSFIEECISKQFNIFDESKVVRNFEVHNKSTNGFTLSWKKPTNYNIPLKYNISITTKLNETEKIQTKNNFYIFTKANPCQTYNVTIFYFVDDLVGKPQSIFVETYAASPSNLNATCDKLIFNNDFNNCLVSWENPCQSNLNILFNLEIRGQSMGSEDTTYKTIELNISNKTSISVTISEFLKLEHNYEYNITVCATLEKNLIGNCATTNLSTSYIQLKKNSNNNLEWIGINYNTGISIRTSKPICSNFENIAIDSLTNYTHHNERSNCTYIANIYQSVENKEEEAVTSATSSFGVSKPPTHSSKPLVVAVILIPLAVLILIILLVFYFFYIKNKRKGNRVVDAEIPLVSKRQIRTEYFEILENNSVISPQVYGNLPKNKDKNRYTDVVPYDENRVVLLNDDEKVVSSEDYINASYMKGYSGKIEYIACQGPLENTCADFWKMVLNQNITLIVMLCQFTEGTMDTCFKYFANLKDIKKFEDICVKVVSEKTFDNYCVRKIEVRTSSRKLRVYHMQFLIWSQFGTLDSAKELIDFSKEVRKKFKSGYILVHCSAGVGRTGTFLALDIGMQTIGDGKKFSVYETVLNLRKGRPGMVQNLDQYKYIYECINYYENSVNSY